MDSNELPKPKKSRFKPVMRQRLVSKNVFIKREVKDEPDLAKGMEMVQQFNLNLEAKKNAKHVRKDVSSTLQQSYNPSRSIDQYQGDAYLQTQKVNLKNYIEPWDHYSHYPVTLPLREPDAGDPVLLDKEEFTENTELDEQQCNASKELGLMVEQDEPTFVFMQFPPNLPMVPPMLEPETKEVNEGSKPQKPARKRCTLNDIPACYMGKLLVYNSGAVKLKIADVLYDVSPGVNTVFAQEFVAINAKDKLFCPIGELKTRAVLTPDFDSIFDTPQEGA